MKCKYILIMLIGFIATAIILTLLPINEEIEPTARDKAECMEYALRNHKWEIGEERFEWLSQWGDPNDIVFFYESCLGHITGVPAEKKYMRD